jgi:hypothetical protein
VPLLLSHPRLLMLPLGLLRLVRRTALRQMLSVQQRQQAAPECLLMPPYQARLLHTLPLLLPR